MCCCRQFSTRLTNLLRTEPNMNSESLYSLLRESHIALGIAGLVAFWIPAIAKKGGRVHVLAGRVFEWCGYYVATTAILACARYLLTPHHFAFIDRPEASAEEIARVQFAQFFLTLLGVLAILFLAQLRTGMRVIRTRKESAAVYQNIEARFWLYVQPLVCLALVAYGAYRLANGSHSVHWISVAVGILPLTDFRKELHFFRNPRESKMSWCYKHMECMMGCGIAFHTAGLVFSTRWLAENMGYGLPGAWQIVPWVLPAAIGVPVAQWLMGQYKKKFGDASLSATGAP